jgi:hypothetical protein
MVVQRTIEHIATTPDAERLSSPAVPWEQTTLDLCERRRTLLRPAFFVSVVEIREK